MAWPRGFKRREPDGSIPLNDERVPPNIPLDNGQAMIHFDLDPYNGMFSPVLPQWDIKQTVTLGLVRGLLLIGIWPYTVMIGDFNPDGSQHSHERVPVFKVRCSRFFLHR